MADELLDIVDENDQVVGQEYRSEIYKKRQNNFRVINAFLVNDKHEVWIPRRLATKKLYPLCLDASVGGHVMAGEGYQEAFVRELAEELNIDASCVKHQFCAKLTPGQHGVSAYMQVYLISTNESPCFNPNDFDSAAWYDIEELQKILNAGEPSKSDLPILIHVLHHKMMTF